MPEEVRLPLQCQVDILRIELECLKEQYEALKNFTVDALKDLYSNPLPKD